MLNGSPASLAGPEPVDQVFVVAELRLGAGQFQDSLLGLVQIPQQLSRHYDGQNCT